ncbi:MAG TPA: hypothetical protein VLB82_12265 [Thermodesulfobacteriota bacterium]|jgi:hypothetical protein|nr:hypothetical protein [Thermodesulfobacteriota bacterium]
MDLSSRLNKFFKDSRQIKELSEEISITDFLLNVSDENYDTIIKMMQMIDRLDIPDIDLVFEDTPHIESNNMGLA